MSLRNFWLLDISPPIGPSGPINNCSSVELIGLSSSSFTTPLLPLQQVFLFSSGKKRAWQFWHSYDIGPTFVSRNRCERNRSKWGFFARPFHCTFIGGGNS